MGWDHFTASDGFAIGMIVVIGMSFGVILSLFTSMRRHAKRRDPHVDELLQEIRHQEQQLKHQKPETTEAWEKESDWWKKP